MILCSIFKLTGEDEVQILPERCQLHNTSNVQQFVEDGPFDNRRSFDSSIQVVSAQPFSDVKGFR